MAEKMKCAECNAEVPGEASKKGTTGKDYFIICPVCLRKDRTKLKKATIDGLKLNKKITKEKDETKPSTTAMQAKP